MRRIHRTLLFLLAAALLTVPVFADFGPKPQLTVRVENPPEELYYMDLLAEGPPSPYAEGSSGGLPEEERAAFDQALLAALTAAAPEGWHCCVVQDTLIWGDIVSDEDLFQFGYSLPDVCRILMVTKSGETFLSEPLSAKPSSPPPRWTGRRRPSPRRPSGGDTPSNFYPPSCPPWPSRGSYSCCSVCGRSETPWYSWG